MDRDTYRKMEQISKEFYYTIDFKQFISDEYFVDIDDLREKMEEYYNHQHPELLPPELEGYIFNVINRHNFTIYLKNRFGCFIKHEVVDRYYIINDDDFKKKLK